MLNDERKPTGPTVHHSSFILHPSSFHYEFSMTAAEIIAILETKFGDKIKSKKLDAIDPFVTVAPGDLPAVCRFLKDDPRLAFDLLNCISGVDYLEIDPKKAPKAGFEPHLEVVYHLSSFTRRHRFVLKVLLPR